MWKQCQIFLSSKINANGDYSHKSKRCLPLGRIAMSNLDSVLKSRDTTLMTKAWNSQNYGFSSSHVWMWELDHKEGWMPKNWHFHTVVLEKTLESPLDSKIKLVNPKGNQPWIFIGRIDVKLKLQYFGHLMRRVDSLEKTLMLKKIEGKKRRGQQRMRWLDGIKHIKHEFEQTLGDGEGQGSLACCSPWGPKEPYRT